VCVPVKKTLNIADEYKQHFSTFEEDMNTMDDAIENWNAALAMVESDGYISDEEYIHLADVWNEYINEMKTNNPTSREL